jgi:LAO/AO transport system kinase
VNKLLEKIWEHKKYLETAVLASRNKEHAEAELLEALEQEIARSMLSDLRKKGELDEVVGKILARKIDPYSAAEKIIAQRFGKLKETKL